MPRQGALDTLMTSLIPAYGPPGRESGVRAKLRAALRGAGRLREDALGNLHLHRPGKGARLLVVAPMDAPGVIVTRVESNGNARIGILGGRTAAELIGATIIFPTGAHALVAYDRPADSKDASAPDADALYLVTGMPKAAAAKAFPSGAVGMIDTKPGEIGDYWHAASLEHRAGAAAVASALLGARSVPFDLHVIFTAQSELGSRGALTGTYDVDPDMAVVVEVVHVGDAKDASAVTPGEGPCIGLKENGYIAHPQALEWARKAAKAGRVPIQYLVREEGTTDAGAVRRARAGVPTVLIAIPARRTGGPESLIHRRDLERTTDLVARLLATPAAPKPAPRVRTPRRGGTR
jgi:putative aminopeptidase FrvX